MFDGFVDRIVKEDTRGRPLKAIILFERQMEIKPGMPVCVKILLEEKS